MLPTYHTRDIRIPYRECGDLLLQLLFFFAFSFSITFLAVANLEKRPRLASVCLYTGGVPILSAFLGRESFITERSFLQPPFPLFFVAWWMWLVRSYLAHSVLHTWNDERTWHVEMWSAAMVHLLVVGASHALRSSRATASAWIALATLSVLLTIPSFSEINPFRDHDAPNSLWLTGSRLFLYIFMYAFTRWSYTRAPAGVFVYIQTSSILHTPLIVAMLTILLMAFVSAKKIIYIASLPPDAGVGASMVETMTLDSTSRSVLNARTIVTDGDSE